MSKNWKYIIAFAVFLGVAYVANPIPASANGTIPPPSATEFCSGQKAWSMDLNNNPQPADPNCGPGKYVVDVTGNLSPKQPTFEDALNYLAQPEEGGVGSIWFIPEPQTPEPQPVSAPEGFCEGNAEWPLDLNTQIPQDPKCEDGGEYIVDVGGTLSNPFDTFELAVYNLSARGYVGTLWFDPPIVIEPLESQAPQGFCDGTVGWGLNLKFNIPIDPQCPEGRYMVDVGGDFGDVEFDNLQDALTNLTERGQIGALWFIPTHTGPWLTYFPQLWNRIFAEVPDQFCDGVIAWFLNLIQMTPGTPDCDNGKFVVDIGENRHTYNTFNEALTGLRNEGNKGTVWFVPAPPEPTAISAPDNFCKGTVGWTINLALHVPVNPNCGSGKYLSDAGTSKETLLDFISSVEYIRSHGKNGTLWYLD